MLSFINVFSSYTNHKGYNWDILVHMLIYTCLHMLRLLMATSRFHLYSIEKELVSLTKRSYNKHSLFCKYFFFENYNATVATARIGNLHLIELLYSRGFDIRTKTSNGSTAMHIACFRSHRQIVSFLIRKGAYVSVENADGETPFSLLQIR